MNYGYMDLHFYSYNHYPLGRPRLRWEDLVKRDVESLNDVPKWKTKATDRETWRIGCLTGWS